MPAPAQDASRPILDWSMTVTAAPWLASSQAVESPITPPPTTITSDMRPELSVRRTS